MLNDVLALMGNRVISPFSQTSLSWSQRTLFLLFSRRPSVLQSFFLSRFLSVTRMSTWYILLGLVASHALFRVEFTLTMSSLIGHFGQDSLMVPSSVLEVATNVVSSASRCHPKISVIKVIMTLCWKYGTSALQFGTKFSYVSFLSIYPAHFGSINATCSCA